MDPIDDAARRFYRRFDFQDFEGDERGRMYIRIDEALATFEESKDASSLMRDRAAGRQVTGGTKACGS